MIPKIIHQIWIGPKPPPMDLINTVIQHNPDYQHILWTEQKIEENKHLFKNYEKYHLIKPPAYNAKTNLIRYEIIYHFGGFYFDADFKFLKGIGDFFVNHEFFVVCENNRIYGKSLYNNGVFGAIPKHPILETTINEIHSQKNNVFTEILQETSCHYFGPRFFTKQVKNYIEKNPHLTIGNPPLFKDYDSYYFAPYGTDGKPTFLCNEKDLDHIFAHHLWKNCKY